MLWTKYETKIHAHARSGIQVIRRDANTVIVTLTVGEALGLVQEISQAFGIEGVPANAVNDEIHLVIEDPDGFFPAKTIDA